MKYIIIGGNGFVGRYLANELLNEQKNVLVCDLQKELHSSIENSCSYLNFDITHDEDYSKLLIASDDVVINLAANQYHTKVPNRKRDFHFASVNTIGTQKLLNHLLKANCRSFIMFSTDMIYGKPTYLPVDKNHPKNPFGPYGKSKLMAENICLEYRKKGINICIFRPRMINGPGRLGILTKLFLLMDKNLPVPTIGNGMNQYQMISVFDCISAIQKCIQKGIPNDEFNLGSNNPPHIKSLLEEVIKKSGSKSKVIPTPGKLVKAVLATLDFFGLTLMYKEQFMIADENYLVDIENTKKILDWEPQYNDLNMLSDAYANYRKQQ